MMAKATAERRAASLTALSTVARCTKGGPNSRNKQDSCWTQDGVPPRRRTRCAAGVSLYGVARREFSGALAADATLGTRVMGVWGLLAPAGPGQSPGLTLSSTYHGPRHFRRRQSGPSQHPWWHSGRTAGPPQGFSGGGARRGVDCFGPSRLGFRGAPGWRVRRRARGFAAGRHRRAPAPGHREKSRRRGGQGKGLGGQHPVLQVLAAFAGGADDSERKVAADAIHAGDQHAPGLAVAEKSRAEAKMPDRRGEPGGQPRIAQFGARGIAAAGAARGPTHR